MKAAPISNQPLRNNASNKLIDMLKRSRRKVSKMVFPAENNPSPYFFYQQRFKSPNISSAFLFLNSPVAWIFQKLRLVVKFSHRQFSRRQIFPMTISSSPLSWAGSAWSPTFALSRQVLYLSFCYPHFPILASDMAIFLSLEWGDTPSTLVASSRRSHFSVHVQEPMSVSSMFWNQMLVVKWLTA